MVANWEIKLKKNLSSSFTVLHSLHTLCVLYAADVHYTLHNAWYMYRTIDASQYIYLFCMNTCHSQSLIHEQSTSLIAMQQQPGRQKIKVVPLFRQSKKERKSAVAGSSSNRIGNRSRFFLYWIESIFAPFSSLDRREEFVVASILFSFYFFSDCIDREEKEKKLIERCWMLLHL